MTPGRRWVLDGGAALTAPTDVVGGQVHGYLIPVGLLEGWFSILPAMAVGLGATLRAELAPNPSLLNVAPRASIRGTLKQRFWLAVLAEAPNLGQPKGGDRTDFSGSIFVGYNP